MAGFHAKQRKCTPLLSIFGIIIFIIISLIHFNSVNVGFVGALQQQQRGPQRPPSFPRNGCAGKPSEKKRVAVVGSGGYLGALTFGFLQRSCSLYGTGIGKCRCIGATADTSVRLNRILSRNFCLAVADETYIQLTDMQSVDYIERQLSGWDAVVFGTDIFLSKRPVTANTFERTPNDKTYEVLWDVPPAKLDDANRQEQMAWSTVKDSIVANIIEASKKAGIRHMVVVADDESSKSVDNLGQRLLDSGVPFTYVRPVGGVSTYQDYTYRTGVTSSINVRQSGGSIEGGEESGSDQNQVPVSREDLAALCVQCLQSLDWTKSRSLDVSSNGPVELPSYLPSKRPDQEWCVNSLLLEASLSGIA